MQSSKLLLSIILSLLAFAALICVAMPLAASASTPIFKCIADNGAISYSATPCSENSIVLREGEAASDQRGNAAAKFPALNVRMAEKHCEQKWTERGELNSRMYRYCMNQQEDGFYRAKLLYRTYSAGGEKVPDMDGILAFAHSKWAHGRGGNYEWRMVAFEMKKQIDGYLETQYIASSGAVSQSGQDRCYSKWLQMGRPLWNMVAYCLKQ